jgi:hypothetical protein
MQFPARWLLASVLICGACQGNERIALPEAHRIASIQVTAGRASLKNSITDPADVSRVLQAASALAAGWQTERQMALTTGWFTYPTPQDSAAFRDLDGSTPLVLWFGPGWFGCAVTDDAGRKRYFRKVTDREVADLRAALRISIRTGG